MLADAQPQAARTGDAVWGDLASPAMHILWDQKPQVVCVQTPQKLLSLGSEVWKYVICSEEGRQGCF